MNRGLSGGDARTRARWASVGTAAWLIAAGVSTWLAAPSVTTALVALAFAPYALLVVAPLDLAQARRALVLAALTSAALVAAEPALSDDVYRFLWDGRVLRHGFDPYRYAPDDPALAHLRDAAWHHINHREIPTIYPPLAQLAFGLLDALAHSVHVMKAAAALAHLSLCAWLVHRARPRAATLLALNPLALSESALNGHFDIAVGGTLALAALSACEGARLRASVWLAAASGLKMIGLLLTPLAGHKKRPTALLAFALGLLVLLPQWLPRPDALSGAGHYARRWRGNDGGFALVQAGVHAALYAAAGADERERGHFTTPSLSAWLERTRGTPLDPWRGAHSEKKEVPDRSDFPIDFLAGLLARAVVALSVALFVLALWVRDTSPLRSARLTLLLTLWLAPQVHPWYLLWLLPLECVAGGLTGLVWSVLVLVAYAPLDLWHSSRQWLESDLIRVVEFAMVGLVFVAEPWLLRGLSAVRESPTPLVESAGPPTA